MFDVLQTVLPIPSSPVQNDEHILLQNQNALGFKFPTDFANFSRVYGSGEVSDDKYSWEIVSGASQTYSTFVDEFREIFGEMRESHLPYTLPLTLFPEKDGLLPFGWCANGVWWCWKTSGVPAMWIVVNIDCWAEYGFRSYEIGFAEFLVKVLRGEIELDGKTLSSDPNKVVTFISKEL